MTQNDTPPLGSPLAVMTGAGGGLAPAVARAFWQRGYRLALVARPGGEPAAEALARELTGAADHGDQPTQGSVRAYGVDLSLPGETASVMRRVESDMGAVSALLNLAGGFAMGGPVDDGPELLNRMLQINLHTAVNATAAVLPGMLQRGAGFVAAIGANAVVSPAPGMSAYAAAKGALAAFQRSLAAEVAAKGVNAALLIPTGAIDTPGNRASMPKADPANWLDPAALADALLYLAGTERRGWVHELVISPR